MNNYNWWLEETGKGNHENEGWPGLGDGDSRGAANAAGPPHYPREVTALAILKRNEDEFVFCGPPTEPSEEGKWEQRMLEVWDVPDTWGSRAMTAGVSSKEDVDPEDDYGPPESNDPAPDGIRESEGINAEEDRREYGECAPPRLRRRRGD